VSDDGQTRIRFALEADAAVIAGIHMTSRSAAMPYLPPQKRTYEQVTRWVRDVLLGQCRTWVAVRDGEIMGYAALDGDMLEHLYLRPDVRRQGIGTLLLDEVRRRSPDGVSLHVFQQNADARALAQARGGLRTSAPGQAGAGARNSRAPRNRVVSRACVLVLSSGTSIAPGRPLAARRPAGSMAGSRPSRAAIRRPSS
jgi:GNAT superfamily N-acetyltransferase